MPVPRRRHCPSRRDRRRAQHKLEEIQSIVACPKCGHARLPHEVCPGCGDYKGRHYGPVKPVTGD